MNKTAKKATGCTAAAAFWARKRTLENAINALAGGLPEGWTVCISVENGAAWAEVQHPDGHITSVDEPDGDLYDCLRSASRFVALQQP